MASAASPLSALTRLSPNSYIFRPPASAASSAPPPSNTTLAARPPRLVLICTWMGARDVHIAKYVARYRAECPTSQLLVVRCEMSHMFLPHRAASHVAPAAAALRSILAQRHEVNQDGDASAREDGQSSPEMLIHVFSNGGVAMLGHVTRGLRLPPHVLVLDSCPGLYSLEASIEAFTVGISSRFWRAVFTPLVRAFFLLLNLLGRVLRRKDPLAQLYAALNERSREGELRRVYVYSEEDRLVKAGHVEEHAAKARELGFDVRLEKFPASPHVAHAKTDEKRYWRVVDEIWRGEK